MIWSSTDRAVLGHPIDINKMVGLDSWDTKVAVLVIRMIREDRGRIHATDNSYGAPE